MKIILTKDEVKNIILAHLFDRHVLEADTNYDVSINDYNSQEFASIKQVDIEETN